MKKVLCIALMAAVMLQTGCLSMANHHRVKNNMIESRIIASGNERQINLLKQGVKPTQIVKFTPLIANNKVDGATVSVDMLALTGYGETFGEAPKTSWAALAGDVVLTGLAVYYGTGMDKSSDNDDDTSNSGIDIATDGDGNTYNIVYGDNNSSNNDDNNQTSGSGSNDITTEGE